MTRPPALARAATEFLTLGGLVLPILVTQLSQMTMGVMDAMMAGRVSSTDLAGVTLGGNLYFPTMLLMYGIILSVTPSVSQLHGAGRLAEAGAVVRQALWIAAVGGTAIVLVLHQAEPVYRWLDVDERAIPIAVAYLRATSLGMVPLLAYASLRCLCEGMSWTRPAMFISLSALLLKLPLNWLFIYGEMALLAKLNRIGDCLGLDGLFIYDEPVLGVPAMGGVGCGWATALVMVYMLAAMLGVAFRSRIRAANTFAVFSWPNFKEIARLLKLGLPIGLALFMEVAFFSSVTLLVGRLGVEIVASHQVAFNVASVAFMVPMSLGMAATIRVGFNVGAGNLAGARISAWVAVGTTLIWGFLLAVAMLTLRHDIVALYSTETEVVRVAAGLLAIGAMFQVFDSSQATAMGALRGYKDTSVPMFIAFFAYWALGLPIGYALCYGVDGDAGLTIDGQGIHGFWWGLVVGLAIAALALIARLLQVSRRAIYTPPDSTARWMP